MNVRHIIVLARRDVHITSRRELLLYLERLQNNHGWMARVAENGAEQGLKGVLSLDIPVSVS